MNSNDDVRLLLRLLYFQHHKAVKIFTPRARTSTHKLRFNSADLSQRTFLQPSTPRTLVRDEVRLRRSARPWESAAV